MLFPCGSLTQILADSLSFGAEQGGKFLPGDTNFDGPHGIGGNLVLIPVEIHSGLVQEEIFRNFHGFFKKTAFRKGCTGTGIRPGTQGVVDKGCKFPFRAVFDDESGIDLPSGKAVNDKVALFPHPVGAACIEFTGFTENPDAGAFRYKAYRFAVVPVHRLPIIVPFPEAAFHFKILSPVKLFPLRGILFRRLPPVYEGTEKGGIGIFILQIQEIEFLRHGGLSGICKGDALFFHKSDKTGLAVFSGRSLTGADQYQA